MQSKYEVIGIVGEGAYGVVYKCKNKETGDYVALKKFKEIEDELVKKTMMRELKVLQMLKHDNIVEYKEAFKRKGDLFLVFEYVDKNLLELLQEHPRGLDLIVIKKLIFQLCKAIKYLHDMNIIHRDIKPENLLVDSTLKLKLCDFGFARTIKKNNEKLTDYVATRWYRSPELLITSGYYGVEVDYWAIGCIMGELVDGDPLFPGDNELDQIAVIQKVLGKLPDNQLELFYNNPNFKGRKLPEIGKPETLERRYQGKISKQAIGFMKALLNPDPKLRLKGDAVFFHPFFENFQDPFPTAGLNPKIITGHNSNPTNHINPLANTMHASITSTSNMNPNKDININSSNLIGNINTNNSLNSENLLINSKAPTNIPLQQDKKQKPVQPIITNTTNINIINYNNYDSKLKMNASSQNFQQPIVIQKKSNIKFEKENFLTTEHNKNVSKKSLNDKILNSNNILPAPGNMVLTSYNFNQNSKKDNLFKLYSSTTFHNNNFKTFYKGDPYNFDIDVNFVREKEKDSEQKVQTNNNKNSLLVIDEEKLSSKRHSKVNENTLQTNTNAERSPNKNKKKSILPGKIPTVGHGINEDLYKILSNRQQPNTKIVTKSNTINKNANANASIVFQLPNITNKNFSLKKLLK